MIEDLDATEVVGCDAGVLLCLLREHGSEAALWLFVVLGLMTAGVMAVALAYVENRRERPARETRRDGRARVVAGPVHRDGVWIRLLEVRPGVRRFEVYGVGGWVPVHRDPSQFFAPTRRMAPGRRRSGPPRAMPPA